MPLLAIATLGVGRLPRRLRTVEIIHGSSSNNSSAAAQACRGRGLLERDRRVLGDRQQQRRRRGVEEKGRSRGGGRGGGGAFRAGRAGLDGDRVGRGEGRLAGA